MKVLVIGSGGREHALVWKLAQSPRVETVYCAPGNGGTGLEGVNVPLGVSDFDALSDFAKQHGVGLTVVGPEVPLIDGIVDHFQHQGLRIFGPNAVAAQLEGSKIFAKEAMVNTGVPTGAFRPFDDADRALAFLRDQPVDKPWVVKADGNALGKGVLMCEDRAEAMAAVETVMVQREFGAAGDRISLEERLYGYEVSLLGICSGQDMLPLAPAQDYKRIGDGDTGPNTGGMGCYSPVPNFPPALVEFCREKVFAPILRSLDFTGVLYAGLMITADGPKVIEFNVRFGDPETQVILPRLESDLLDLLEAAVDGYLGSMQALWTPRKAVSVVLASGGYPGDYEKGKPITGLRKAAELPDVTVFHAGTKVVADQVVTNGGRVLNVTALGDTFADAIDRAYGAIHGICWEGMQYRKDIAARVR
ncbi:MAG: phosphoribosylamine--glycine ligase [Armatimonadota bacterium]